ncbi:MAG: response regulator [Puniceicoccales bacterium]|jgi:CheY-like chemotaxis protein|nr:response regulator [Puniceicoccales bacterium]
MKKIFLIEDDVNLCGILSKMLKFEGIEVMVAHSGLAAREILERINSADAIDAILCDVMMPGMDGYEFLEYVKQSGKFAAIPFIFISACVSKDEEEKGLSMGAKAFLKKPINILTILSTLNNFSRN